MSKLVEEWRWIIGYEGMYQVSNYGDIKSLKFGKEQIMKPALNGLIGKGYLFVCLCKEGIIKSFLVHQLIAMSFLEHVIDGHNLVVNHINGIKTDNRVENLEIVTQRNNVSTRVRKDRNTKSSPLTGASWSKSNKKWYSQYQYQGIRYSLGFYNTDKEAHNKWKEATEADKGGTFIDYYINLKNDNYKKILQYSKNGEFIREWNTATQVLKE